MVEVKKETQYRGIGIGQGLARGRVFFYATDEEKAGTDEEYLGVEQEVKRLEEALDEATEQLKALSDTTRENLGGEEGEIFEIHAMLLADEDFTDMMREEIRRGQTAAAALTVAVETFASRFAAMDDAYMAARAVDIRDVGKRVADILQGKETPSAGPRGDEPFIVVARDLTPSQTVTLDRSRLLGFVTMEGTPTSHTAILARAMCLPVLVGAGPIPAAVNGREAILDAAKGVLTVDPGEETCRVYEENRKKADERAAELLAGQHLPAVTKSGHSFRLYANIGSVGEWQEAQKRGAEGVGLFRSEFLFLETEAAPDEETQFRAYRDVAEAAGGKLVIIRTLDAGADKQIPYLDMPREENPALGIRAIRLCLARPALFSVQLRAILRASAYGKLAIMLPMIVSTEEVIRAKAMLEREKEKLDREAVYYDHNIGFGIMIETPAAALMCDKLAPLCDFFSVGTNDLMQYTLAADRQNPALETLCRNNTEPVLRLIEMAAAHMHRSGGWIGICGELAADPALTQRFCHMKLDELSVAADELPELRRRIRECE